MQTVGHIFSDLLQEKPGQDDGTSDSTSNSTSNSTSRGQVSDSVIRLLLALSGEMSMREMMMDKLGFTSRPMFQDNYLTPALDSDLVERTQPESPKSPTQKYRLTAAGREVLKEYLSEH